MSHLTSVSSNDSGNYTCLVTNASGENGNKTVEVVVEGDKVPLGEVVPDISQFR